MNAKHPIDDLFAQGLRDAEAVPPPELGDRVLAQVGKGGRGAGRKRWAIGLLLLLLGSAAFFVRPQKSEAAGAAPTAERKAGAALHTGLPAGNTNERTAPNSSTLAIHTTTGANSSTSAHHVNGPISESPAFEPNPVPKAAIASALASAHNTASPDHGLPPSATEYATPGAAQAAIPAVLAGHGPHGNRRSEELTALAYLSVRTNALQLSEAGTIAGYRSREAYVRNRGRWIIGLHAGSMHEQPTWRNGPTAYREALNASSSTNYPTAFGIDLGRQWASGWELHAGLGYLATRHVYGRSVTYQEVQTSVERHVVSVGSNVVWSSVDTIRNTITNVAEQQLVTRYGTFRAPVEAIYLFGQGRWRFGPRAGLSWERSLFRENGVLLNNNGDLPAGPVTMSTTQAPRTQNSVHALLGLEARMQLNERWSLRATPFHERSLLLLSDPELPRLYTARWGLHVGVLYNFNR